MMLLENIEMREWNSVSTTDDDSKKKRRIARRPKKLVEDIKLKARTIALSAAALIGGMVSQGQNVVSRKAADKAGDYYAYLMKTNPGKDVFDITSGYKNLTFEDAAKDRTSYVFMQVVSNMDSIAQKGLKVWKNPSKKRAFVSDIFQTAVDYRSTASSCLAACSASIIGALKSLDDNPDFMPKSCRTYGNNLVSEKEFKNYVVSVKPGVNAIEKAIEANDVQPGDLILVPRNYQGNYHSVMYVGKNDNGEPVYSACNNPAYRKTFDYYNKRAQTYKRDIKIIKLNQKYYDECLEDMKKEEKKGTSKEVIIAVLYDSMHGNISEKNGKDFSPNIPPRGKKESGGNIIFTQHQWKNNITSRS